jgi:replication initiation protein RepC
MLPTQRFYGLPEGVTRWRLAAALRGAARPLGLSASMLALLELYIDLSYDADWTPGAEPIIIRPLYEIAERLGRSERQVRNLERRLADCGLLAWRDSGNHRRQGRRDWKTNRLIYGYGPTLAPLGARASEIIALAQREREEIMAIRRSRLAIASLKRTLNTLLANLDEPVAAELAHEHAQLPPRNPAGTPICLLEAQRAKLTDLVERARTQLRKTSGMEEISSLHTTNTKENNAVNSVHRRSDIKVFENERGKETKQQKATVTDNIIQIANECTGPFFKNALGSNSQPTWPHMIAAADEVALCIGIKNEHWNNIKHKIGHNTAAISILLIENRLNVHNNNKRIRNPSAYIEGLAAKHASGALRLETSLKAYLKEKKSNRLSISSSATKIVDGEEVVI